MLCSLSVAIWTEKTWQGLSPPPRHPSLFPETRFIRYIIPAPTSTHAGVMDHGPVGTLQSEEVTWHRGLDGRELSARLSAKELQSWDGDGHQHARG